MRVQNGVGLRLQIQNVLDCSLFAVRLANLILALSTCAEYRQTQAETADEATKRLCPHGLNGARHAGSSRAGRLSVHHKASFQGAPRRPQNYERSRTRFCHSRLPQPSKIGLSTDCTGDNFEPKSRT